MRTKRTIAIAATGVLIAAAAGGGAYAANQTSNPRQAFLSDVAHRLGVPESKLQAAIAAARRDHPYAGFGHRQDRPLAAVSTYLGVTPAQLRSELRSGKTLAQVAQAHGKTVAGLEQAIEAAAKSRLDQAVKAGRLSSAQEQQILSTLSSRISDLVNAKAPQGGYPGHQRLHGGPGFPVRPGFFGNAGPPGGPGPLGGPGFQGQPG